MLPFCFFVLDWKLAWLWIISNAQSHVSQLSRLGFLYKQGLSQTIYKFWEKKSNFCDLFSAIDKAFSIIIKKNWFKKKNRDALKMKNYS